jgi:hypothetical protein
MSREGDDVKTRKSERMAVGLGLSGVLPFALLAVALWSPQWRALAQPVLLAYSALILSFLGGVRWGRALAADRPIEYVWAVLPSLWALLALQLPPLAGLLVLGAGFVGQWWLDGPADRLPVAAWFRRFRGLLTALVLACHLIAVLALLPA